MCRKVSLLVVFLTLIANVVLAVNPADLTNSHRSFLSEYYKIGYDDGPRFVFANLPVNKTVNVSIFNWQNGDGSYRLSKMVVTKKFSSWFDGSIDTTFTKDSISEDMIGDAHWNMLGIGVLLPLQSDEDIRVGPRVTIRGLTLCLTTFISKDNNNLYGLIYCIKDIKAEVSYGDETWFLRVSKSFKTSFGTLFPESRNKFTKDGKSFGLAIGFIPN